MAEARYCTKCKFIGPHGVEREVTGSQWAMLVFWLLCFVIPGVIYALHLATGGGARRFYVCPKCGARRMSVPVDAPIAQMELAAAGRSLPAETLPPPRKPMSPRMAWGITLAIVGALGLAIALSR